MAQFNRGKVMKDQKPTDEEAQEGAKPNSKKRDLAYEAATHDTEMMKPTQPGQAEHAAEATGRRADDTWKTKKSP